MTSSKPSVGPEIRRLLDSYGERAEVCDSLGVFQMRKKLTNGGYLTIRYGYRDRAKKRNKPRKGAR